MQPSSKLLRSSRHLIYPRYNSISNNSYPNIFNLAKIIATHNTAQKERKKEKKKNVTPTSNKENFTLLQHLQITKPHTQLVTPNRWLVTQRMNMR